MGVDVKMQDVKPTKRKTKSVPQTNPPDNVQEKERKKKTESHPSWNCSSWDKTTWENQESYISASPLSWSLSRNLGNHSLCSPDSRTGNHPAWSTAVSGEAAHARRTWLPLPLPLGRARGWRRGTRGRTEEGRIKPEPWRRVLRLWKVNRSEDAGAEALIFWNSQQTNSREREIQKETPNLVTWRLEPKWSAVLLWTVPVYVANKLVQHPSLPSSLSSLRVKRHWIVNIYYWQILGRCTAWHIKHKLKPRKTNKSYGGFSLPCNVWG